MSNELSTEVGDGVSAVGFLQDDALFNRVERFATLMASGRATIPAELRTPGDCMAITLQAMQWKMNPISLAQKVFFIQGKIGYEAQAIAAAINASNSITSTFEYEWFGPWEKVIGKFEIKKNDKGQYRVPGWRLEDEEGCGINVSATLRGEQKPRVLTLLLAQARTRNSTQWADDPKQQLAYLAQKKWARLYAPHIILGAYTPDELSGPAEIDMGAAEVVDTKPATTPKATQSVKPDYTEPDFDADKDTVRKAVKAGRLTIDGALERIRSKFVLGRAFETRLRDYVSNEDSVQADTVITAEQVADVEALADEFSADISALCEQFGVPRLADLQSSRLGEFVALIKQES